jgi:hypothetical protein
MGYKTISTAHYLLTTRTQIWEQFALKEDAIELKGSISSVRNQLLTKKSIENHQRWERFNFGESCEEIMNNIPSVSVDPQTNQLRKL